MSLKIHPGNAVGLLFTLARGRLKDVEVMMHLIVIVMPLNKFQGKAGVGCYFTFLLIVAHLENLFIPSYESLSL